VSPHAAEVPWIYAAAVQSVPRSQCGVFTAGTLQEYQKRMKKLDQQYKERLRNAGMF